MLDNYAAGKPAAIESAEVTCRNCGRKRHAVWAVARLLPKDAEGRPYTEVCHQCLNEERIGRGAVRVRST